MASEAAIEAAVEVADSAVDGPAVDGAGAASAAPGAGRPAPRSGWRTGREADPGDRWVTERTRQFELQDEQVFAGAGRGPTPAEEAAAERAGPVSEHTREAYRAMAWRGANHPGEGRLHR